ncbi:MAG TPA: lactate utilization protein [Alphaproteobacteria bacterium]|jgi:L-lactate dehydrogenase complex protein LldG
MSTARDQILAVLREGYRGRHEPAAKVGADARVARRRANLVPARAQPENRKAALGMFIAMAEEASATVARVHTMIDVPNAVADFLRNHNLPMRAALAPDPALDAARWERRKTLELRKGRAEPFDEVGISLAWKAVAETGTLVMLSGEATPTTLNFLPETEIVILPADRVVGSYEEALAPLRSNGEDSAKHALPRVVNFVTGPSRSADIEQTLQLGAHGPRRLHIVIVDGAAGP